MKIGIMSDSHDNVPMIRRAVERLQKEGAECLIHAGDFVAPFAVREILKFRGAVYGCFGNNDGEKAGIRKLWPEVADPPRMLTLGGRRILLIHDLDSLEAMPDEGRKADVVIFGHTHEPALEPGRKAGSLRVNPGEAGGWLSGKPTVAMLDTDTLQAKILEL